MKMVTTSGKIIMLKNTVKPKMTDVNGRTWDALEVVKIDGEYYDLLADTTWGFKFYIHYNEKWYSGDVFEIDGLSYKEEVKIYRGN